MAVWMVDGIWGCGPVGGPGSDGVRAGWPPALPGCTGCEEYTTRTPQGPRYGGRVWARAGSKQQGGVVADVG